MNSWSRTDRLLVILEEHSCWDDPRWKADAGLRADPKWRRDWLRYVLQFRLSESTHDADGLAALRAAIDQVEDGSIFGSSTRCAVCDKDSNGNTRNVVGHDVWACDPCGFGVLPQAAIELAPNACGDREADAARIVIRARKLNARRTAERRVDMSKYLGLVDKHGNGPCLSCSDMHGTGVGLLDPNNGKSPQIWLCEPCRKIRDMMRAHLAPGVAERWLASQISKQADRLAVAERQFLAHASVLERNAEEKESA